MASSGMNDVHDRRQAGARRYLELALLRHKGGACHDAGGIIMIEIADHAATLQRPPYGRMAIAG